MTYQEAIEKATKKLKEFKEDHEDIIKDFDAYKEAAKEYDKLNAEFKKAEKSLEQAEQNL